MHHLFSSARKSSWIINRQCSSVNLTAALQHEIHVLSACESQAAAAVESCGPSRHLWLGNLHPRVPRTTLRDIFSRFGPLEDAVTFSGRMYGFVNFWRVEDAVTAVQQLHGQQVGRRVQV